MAVSRVWFPLAPSSIGQLSRAELGIGYPIPIAIAVIDDTSYIRRYLNDSDIRDGASTISTPLTVVSYDDLSYLRRFLGDS